MNRKLSKMFNRTHKIIQILNNLTVINRPMKMLKKMTILRSRKNMINQLLALQQLQKLNLPLIKRSRRPFKRQLQKEKILTSKIKMNSSSSVKEVKRSKLLNLPLMNSLRLKLKPQQMMQNPKTKMRVVIRKNGKSNHQILPNKLIHHPNK